MPQTATQDSSARLKKSKRDLQRLLSKKDLPANVKNEKQKILKSIELRLQAIQERTHSRKVAKKYHMVRFFEKKKALKLYKHAKKELDELVAKKDESLKKEIKKARKKLAHCEVDLLYVVNFPKGQKYISLFPVDSGSSKETDDKRLEMKKWVKKQHEEGSIPISLEDILQAKIDHNKLIETQQSVVMEEPDKAVEEGNYKDKEEDDFFE